MTTARALIVPRNGDSSVLTVQDVEVPDPGPGEVQVEVAAVGVNFVDVYQREGVYPITTPFVSCSEGAGTVTAVGPEVTDFSAGDRVAWGQASAAPAPSSTARPATSCRCPTGSTSMWPRRRCSRA